VRYGTFVSRKHAVVEGNIMSAYEFEASEEVTALPTHLSDEVRAAVEAWAERQPDKPTLAEALRRLIDRGLAND
jgi:hypothetical protein